MRDVPAKIIIAPLRICEADVALPASCRWEVPKFLTLNSSHWCHRQASHSRHRCFGATQSRRRERSHAPGRCPM